MRIAFVGGCRSPTLETTTPRAPPHGGMSLVAGGGVRTDRRVLSPAVATVSTEVLEDLHSCRSIVLQGAVHRGKAGDYPAYVQDQTYVRTRPDVLPVRSVRACQRDDDAQHQQPHWPDADETARAALGVVQAARADPEVKRLAD